MNKTKDLEVKGYTFGFGARCGDYEKEETINSLNELCKVGVDYIALAFDVLMDNIRATEVRYRYAMDVSDLEIMNLIEEIHNRGVKVCLKPMVDSLDHEWRARINFGYDKGSWAKWFYEYEGFIVHYAKIAEKMGCEMYCIGCELCGTERQEEHWRHLIAEVRKVYSGKVTYNTNHGHELDALWYDALDYVGTSGYFPVANHPNASLEEMKEGWERAANELQRVYEKWHKPVLFMEIGCRSAAGAAMMPWDYMHHEFPVSQEEQANFFQSACEVLSEKDWFVGFFWWDWSIRLYKKENALEDRGFGIYGKVAEKVLSKLYKGL